MESKYNNKTTRNDTVIMSVTKKIEEKMKKIKECKEECKKCNHEISMLRKNLKKDPSNCKGKKALTKLISKKEKMTTRMNKLKEDCKKYKEKLSTLKKKKKRGGGTTTGESLINVATWNILADGLSYGEFLSADGDEEIKWENRGNRIVDSLKKMFNGGIDIIATQENDHPTEILDKLGSEIGMVSINKLSEPRSSNAYKNHWLKSKTIDEKLKETTKQKLLEQGWIKEPNDWVNQWVRDDHLVVYYKKSQLGQVGSPNEITINSKYKKKKKRSFYICFAC